MRFKMGKRKNQIRWQAWGTAVCLGLLLLAGSGCQNSPTTDEPDQARIRVNNNCGIAIDIYMDTKYQFFLENQEYYYIENLELGTHLLEAMQKGTQTPLKSTVAEITAKQDYTWTVSSTAAVVVTNNYGETISLYGDGTFQTDIDDQVTATISNMPYGEHLFEAKRPDESEVLASTTIVVLGDNIYKWTIAK